MENKLDALIAATAAQDSVIASLVRFMDGLPDLINTAVAAKEAGDESAVGDLTAHIKANTQAIANAVTAGTAAAAPESGNNDDPVAAAAARADTSPAVTTEPAATTDADAKDAAADDEITDTAASAETPEPDASHPDVAEPTTYAANGDITPAPVDDAAADANQVRRGSLFSRKQN